MSKQHSRLFTYMEDADFYAAYIGGVGFTKMDEPTTEDDETAKALTGAYSKNEANIAAFLIRHLPLCPLSAEELQKKLGTPEIDLSDPTVRELIYSEQDALPGNVFTLQFTGLYEDLKNFHVGAY